MTEHKILTQTYKDRLEAGGVLSKLLIKYKGSDSVIVAIPRGGVVLGAEIAKELGLPLTIVTPRKIASPYDSEFAIGAVLSDGTLLLDDKIIKINGIYEAYVRGKAEEQIKEAKRRYDLYIEGRTLKKRTFHTVILVDDGIATGLTIKVSIKAVARMADKIILAVPVAPEELIRELAGLVNEVVCPMSPKNFSAVSQFYERFEEVTDEDVISILGSV